MSVVSATLSAGVTTHMDSTESIDDVDLTLRHISRQFPDQFARALLPGAITLSTTGWLDTQITARQRRLDRALDVEVDGHRRLLHAEWQLMMEADVPLRVFEYHVLLALVLPTRRLLRTLLTKRRRSRASSCS